MDIQDLIHHKCFYMSNSLWHPPTASQFYRPLALQPLALVVTAIPCMEFEYGTGIEIMFMFLEDEY